jgi:predicted acyl esterase
MVFGRGRHVRDLLGRLQRAPVAARRPPALKAVIAVSTTHDRYTDDVHWCGGCVYQPMLDWATSMLAYNARPPDPTVVGDGWRDPPDANAFVLSMRTRARRRARR